MKTYRFNTSNKGKQAEYSRMLDGEVIFSSFDVSEIQASPEKVVARKAWDLYKISGQTPILVDDTSLEVEGHPEVGVNVRFQEQNLSSMIGAKATFVVFIAICAGFEGSESVRMYKGEIHGTIQQSSGTEGFGFDPYFVPEGETKSLAESKPDQLNARWLAVQNLINGTPSELVPVKQISTWDYPFQ